MSDMFADLQRAFFSGGGLKSLGYIVSSIALVFFFVRWSQKLGKVQVELAQSNNSWAIERKSRALTRRGSFVFMAIATVVVSIGLGYVPWKMFALYIAAVALGSVLGIPVSAALGTSTPDAKYRDREMSKVSLPMIRALPLILASLLMTFLIALAIVQNFFAADTPAADIRQLVRFFLRPVLLIYSVLLVTGSIVMLRPAIDRVVRVSTFRTLLLTPITTIAIYGGILLQFPPEAIEQYNLRPIWPYLLLPVNGIQLTVLGCLLLVVPILVFFLGSISYNTHRAEVLDRIDHFCDRMTYAIDSKPETNFGRTLSYDALIMTPRLLGEMLEQDDYLLHYWYECDPEYAMQVAEQIELEQPGEAAPPPAEDEDNDENLPAIPEAAPATAPGDLFSYHARSDPKTLLLRMNTELRNALRFLPSKIKRLEAMSRNAGSKKLFNEKQHSIRQWSYRATFAEGLTEIMRDPFNTKAVEETIELFRSEIELRRKQNHNTIQQVTVTSGASLFYTAISSAVIWVSQNQQIIGVLTGQ